MTEQHPTPPWHHQPQGQPPGWQHQPQQPYPHQPPPPYYYAPPPPHPQRTTYKVRKDTSHTFHLLMTVFTCGIWGMFVWLPITIWHKFGTRKKITERHR